MLYLEAKKSMEWNMGCEFLGVHTKSPCQSHIQAFL